MKGTGTFGDDRSNLAPESVPRGSGHRVASIDEYQDTSRHEMNAIAETCPPLEDIAAFLDGTLSEGERALVVSHLTSCSSCYAVFSEAARFQLEEERANLERPEEPIKVAEASALAPVVPLRRRAVSRWALPLAAVLVLGLATIPLYQRYNRMPKMLSSQLVDPAALKGVPASDWTNINRGTGEGSVLVSGPIEILLGAHLVDLRVNLARGDYKESLNALSLINNRMEALSYVDDQAPVYKKTLGDLDEKKRTLKEVAPELVRAEAELTESLSYGPYLAFGKWTEAGRLSARAKYTAFFEDRENRRFPGWLLRNAQEDLDEEVIPTLKRIQGILEDSDPSKLPYQDLAGQFKAILDHYQREAEIADDPLS
ncbi:MAG: zf-HC2 domain-containing protein [Myxococcales bacterium]